MSGILKMPVKKLLEHLTHRINALLFLLHIWVDIKIECGADVGVAEEDADGFVVAFAFNAAGGKAVAEAVETHLGKAQFFLELVEVASVSPGFGWIGSIGKDVEVPTYDLFQWPNQRQKVAGHGNLPDRILGLWLVDNEFSVFFISVHKVDSLDGFTDTDDACGHINVVPLQGTHFTNAQAGIEADEYAEVQEGEVFFYIAHQLALVSKCEDFDILTFALCRKDNVNLSRWPVSTFSPETENHL